MDIHWLIELAVGEKHPAASAPEKLPASQEKALYSGLSVW